MVWKMRKKFKKREKDGKIEKQNLGCHNRLRRIFIFFLLLVVLKYRNVIVDLFFHPLVHTLCYPDNVTNFLLLQLHVGIENPILHLLIE